MRDRCIQKQKKAYFTGGNNMKDTYISDSVLYIGVTDKTLDLFESQYQVPNGVTYNS